MRLAWLLLSLGLIAAAALSLITPLGSLIELKQSDPALAWLVIVELRLPRTLLALCYGAVLGLTGAALQATFGNPLASPDITGSSSGAALGAVAGSYWLGISGPLSLAACGAIGAALSLIALFAVAGRRSETATLLLAGIAIALAAGACTSLLLALAPSPFAFYDSFEWLMGSFVDRSLPQAAAALVPAGLACALLARRSCLREAAVDEAAHQPFETVVESEGRGREGEEEAGAGSCGQRDRYARQQKRRRFTSPSGDCEQGNQSQSRSDGATSS